VAEFPALPLYTDAYLGDTTHLSTFEHGAYLLLLIVSWRSPGCCVADDDTLLARYTRMTRDKWRKIRPILEPFFRIEDGFWHQARLQDELQHLQSKRKQQSDAGTASAKAKSLKRTNRGSTPVGKPSQRNGNEQSTPFTLPIIPLDKSNGAEPDQVFWANAKAFLAPETKGDPGKLIGAWCRDYGGKENVAHAITRAQLERPAQRIPFIVGCLKGAAKPQPAVPL
jgi:uncharacterized protein YdaU (DUF1376 family)